MSSAMINQTGSSNLGVFEIDAITNEGDEVTLIEKRIAPGKRNEILISKYLQMHCLRNWRQAQDGPLPIIHDIKLFGPYISIYMHQYLGVGNKTKKPKTYGSLLSKSLSLMSSYDLPLPAENLFNKETLSLTNPFSLGKSILRKDYLWLHLQALHAIIKYTTLTRAAPIVASHNDLRKDNIAVMETRKGARMNFIDIGLLSNNYAGADLRHVLRMSMRSTYWRRVYRRAVNEYSRTTGCSPQAISCAAHLFALMRWLKTCRGSISKKLDEEKIASQLREAKLLLSSLHAIPVKSLGREI